MATLADPIGRRGRGKRRPIQYGKGRQLEPNAVEEVRLQPGRPAAPARPADRAPAPDPGPLRLAGGPPPGGARRTRCGWRRPRSTRSRPSTPISTWCSRRDAAAAADRPGLRQPDLRARWAARRCGQASMRRGRLGHGVRVVRAPCMGRCEQAPVGRGRPACRSTRPRSESVSVADPLTDDIQAEAAALTSRTFAAYRRGRRLSRSTGRAQRRSGGPPTS